MSRKIARLTLDHLAALEDPCRDCLFWELDPVRRDRVADRAGAKQAWLTELMRDWGSCGRVALVDDDPVGYLVYAPQAYLPGAAAFPTAPTSPDAVLLTTAYVDPAHRGGGLGRMLVQGMARDLTGRGGIAAVEAFGDARGRPGRHVLPIGFLAGVGFKTHRPHPVTPRLRMDLTATVTWRDEVEAALERLVGAVAPKKARGPAPKATRASRGGARSGATAGAQPR